MLILARLAAIAVLVWFFLSAKEKGQSVVNWVIVGLLGYWIAWFAVKLTFVAAFSAMFAKSATGTFLLLQVPTLAAIAAAYFVRRKLISDAENKNDET